MKVRIEYRLNCREMEETIEITSKELCMELNDKYDENFITYIDLKENGADVGTIPNVLRIIIINE